MKEYDLQKETGIRGDTRIPFYAQGRSTFPCSIGKEYGEDTVSADESRGEGARSRTGAKDRRLNCDYHHGQLPPVKGGGCYQVARANRTHPEWDDGVGGTYKHGADLAYWRGRFYLHYFTA